MAKLQDLIITWHNDNGITADMEVRELVMCKDCKAIEINDDNEWWCNELEREIISPLWFCADGVRKEQENE